MPANKKLELGAVSKAVSVMRKRLKITGDLSPDASNSNVFDSWVEGAVRRFQARHGLPADGVMGRYSFAAMNIPASVRLGQLETNLIRLRSMSATVDNRFVMVNIPAAQIEAVENGWNTIDEVTPFSYNFLDQEFNNLHIDTNRSGNLLSAFAILAILIASLGLFGIVSFSMTQRSKEIGVRKVLGASVLNVLILANKEFLILIIVAFIISVPATYWLMSNWLSTFAYHVDIGLWPMMLGFMLTILIAFCTISFESIKAALVNPVDTLRNE